jgi:2-hydroxychromene-2-carboxylate isomerase
MDGAESGGAARRAGLGTHPRWRPIAFAFVLLATGSVPWSLSHARAEGMRVCEERAQTCGLPALQWPPGWPVQSYSLLPLRAALLAEEHGRLRDFSLAAFAENFVHGRGLPSLDAILRAAGAAGVDGTAVRSGASATMRQSGPEGSGHRVQSTFSQSSEPVSAKPSTRTGPGCPWRIGAW